MIITIDGPVATGKTTIAKKLADSIGFVFFDTGAMYRVLTYAIIKEKINLDDLQQLGNFLQNFKIDVKIQKHQRDYFYREIDISEEIRKSEVTSQVSKVAAVKEVRDRITELVHELAKGVNAVFEGRDMGTVVFPEADLKIFLTGCDDVRAKRRYKEHLAKFPEEARIFTLERCLQDLKERDQYDSTREYAPLLQAEDAICIDVSELNINEVVLEILKHKDDKKIKQPL